jgi:hypothetical protein
MDRLSTFLVYGLESLTLLEFSMNRMYKHYLDGGHEAWCLITAWRRDQDIHQNKANQERLESDIGHLARGFVKMQGHGGEKDENGKWIETDEPSFSAFEIRLEDAKSLMEKYRQDAIVYAGPETGGNVWLVERGGSHTDLGEFHPSQLSSYYSSWKSHPFSFA